MFENSRMRHIDILAACGIWRLRQAPVVPVPSHECNGYNLAGYLERTERCHARYIRWHNA